jgi:hypothetical protein
MQEVDKTTYTVDQEGLKIYFGKNKPPSLVDSEGAVVKKAGKSLAIGTAPQVNVTLYEGKGYPTGGFFLDRLEAMIPEAGFKIGVEGNEKTITFPDKPDQSVYARVDVYAIGSIEKNQITELAMTIYEQVEVPKSENLLLKGEFSTQGQIGIADLGVEEYDLEYPDDLTDVVFLSNANALTVLVRQDLDRAFTPIDVMVFNSTSFPADLKKLVKSRGQATLDVSNKGLEIWGDERPELAKLKVNGKQRVRVYTNDEDYNLVDTVVMVISEA